MQKKFCIWDSDSSPDLPIDYSLVFWSNTFVSEKPYCSIPEIVEFYSDELKAQYLKLIYDLGNVNCHGQSVIEQLKIRDNLSYWWMTLLVEKSNWAKSPQITNIVKLMAFGLWLKDSECTEIYIKSDNLELIKAVKMLCTEKDLDLKVLPGSERSLLKKYYIMLRPRTPSWIKVFIWLFREILFSVVFILLEKTSPSSFNSKYIFVTYLSPAELDSMDTENANSSFWGPLPNCLASKKVATSWIYLPSRNFSLATTFKAMKRLKKCKSDFENHALLLSFLNWRALGRFLKDWILISSKYFKVRGSLKGACGIYWPLIKDDVSRSLGGVEMASSLTSFALFENVARLSSKRAKVVYLAESQPWEVGVISSFLSADCYLIGFAHSTIRYWDLRYFNDPQCYLGKGLSMQPKPNIFAVNGVNDQAQLHYFGYPSQNVREVESLRYMYLNDFVSHAINRESQNKKLLVLGEFLKTDTLFMLSFLRSPEVKETLSKLEIIVKPHPACPLTEDDILGFDASIQFCQLSELLPLADIVYTGNVTSAAAEAYSLGKNVISARNFKGLNLSPLRGIEHVNFVSNAKSLNFNLLNCLSDNAPKKNISLFHPNPNIQNWRQILDF